LEDFEKDNLVADSHNIIDQVEEFLLSATEGTMVSSLKQEVHRTETFVLEKCAFRCLKLLFDS
jgi:hypothetical protein